MKGFFVVMLMQMASTLNARAVSHLEEVSDQGIEDMAKAGENNCPVSTTMTSHRSSEAVLFVILSEAVVCPGKGTFK